MSIPHSLMLVLPKDLQVFLSTIDEIPLHIKLLVLDSRTSSFFVSEIS